MFISTSALLEYQKYISHDIISFESTMASFRVPALRHVITGAAPYLRASQRRWAQVHDVRFLATQQSDRIVEKYKEKLDRKAKQ